QHLGTMTSTPDSVALCLNTFSFCAIVTSFFGVGLGQHHFMREITNHRLPQINGGFKRFLDGTLTLLIPLIFATLYPNGFIMALSIASTWLAILALILPGIMGLRAQYFSLATKVLAGVCLGAGILIILIEGFLLR
ncbi:MAG: aromatic amino acid transport family protein, partial [Alphaproteobacteria bacterium]|nr:aromatic amino acid transport family protein [Alphaproteobacteria bacterium]